MINLSQVSPNDLDLTLFFDVSPSMDWDDGTGRGVSRMDSAKEGSKAIIRYGVKRDADGITVYPFSTAYRRVEGIKTLKDAQAAIESVNRNGTDLGTPLQHYANGFLQAKLSGTAKRHNVAVIITDGESTNQNLIEDAIVKCAQVIQRDDEITFIFIQVGNDDGATDFLKKLDNELSGKQKRGGWGLRLKPAKVSFDIVDVKTPSELAQYNSIEEFLVEAFNETQG